MFFSINKSLSENKECLSRLGFLTSFVFHLRILQKLILGIMTIINQSVFMYCFITRVHKAVLICIFEFAELSSKVVEELQAENISL